MRIVAEEDDRLEIRHRPWVTWAVVAILLGGALHEILLDRGIETWERWFTGAIAAGIGWVAWWGLPAVDLSFDRAGLRFVEHRLTGRRIREIPRARITGIRTETDRHASARPNRLVLDTLDGEVPLERGFGPFDRTELARRIAVWLAKGETDQ